MAIGEVQEVQGLYGPFSISEHVIQKIWLQGDFHQEDLTMESGKRLRILDPGDWNRNEGPDFKEARLEIDGEERVGDVEVHFDPNDWWHHGHDRNPNFRKVILHVALYEGPEAGWAASFPMESLVLLPLLERDLEEYVMEAALLDLEQVNELEWIDRFMGKPPEERRALVDALAAERWSQKCAFARKRLKRLDWFGCCHESTLEVLGYARNRTVMHKIASEYSLADFSGPLDTSQVYEAFRGDWRLSGCRPANHPQLRLKQYASICRANPGWPGQLLHDLETAFPAGGRQAAAFRKAAGTRRLHDTIAEGVFQGMVGSKRLNSLLCDALFPLAQAVLGGDWEPYWRHWYPGDYPDSFARFYREAGLGDTRAPMSNGRMQGILLLFASKGGRLKPSAGTRA